MGTTTKGIPYPEGTDRVMDGDDAMKAIAQKVDALLPVTITGSGTTDASGNFTITHNLGVVPKLAIVHLDRGTGALYGPFAFTDNYTTTTVRTRWQDGPGATAPVSTVIPYKATFILT
jgi:hypothetical protein